LKIPRCTDRKFPTPDLHEWASLASDGVEPSAVLGRVLGGTESEAKGRDAASAPSCPRGGSSPALRRSFGRTELPDTLAAKRRAAFCLNAECNGRYHHLEYGNCPHDRRINQHVPVESHSTHIGCQLNRSMQHHLIS
jgi:hypothetical protein